MGTMIKIERSTPGALSSEARAGRRPPWVGTASHGRAATPPPGRRLRRTVVALLLVPPACLLLSALAVFTWGPRSSLAVLVPVVAALAVAAALAWPLAARIRRELTALARQRDAFYEELLRLSRAASLGEVASSIAHDLNNPLAIMREEAGWIQDLMQGGELGAAHTQAEIANALKQIDIQIERSREITQRLLQWGRDSAPQTESVDVNLLLNKTLYLLESELQAAGVRVVKELSPGLAQVRGGAPELRQVFLNLMKNALDAMRGAGGTMTLATRPERGGVRIEIRDTGPGIPAAAIEHIFEPFFTTKAANEGTGLGLPISRWIVEKVGGTLGVESREGAGASFHVTLPAGEARPQTGSGGR